METERGEKNEREQYKCTEEAPASYYRSSIDRSLSISSVPTLRNHYSAVCSRPLKTHPASWWNRQVLLPGRQVQAAQVPFRFNDTLSHTSTDRHVYTHISEHLLPSLRSFRVSVAHAIRPHVALLSPLKKERALSKESRLSTREIIRRNK